MSKLSKSDLKAIVDSAIAFSVKYKTTIEKWGINTNLRKLHFLAQIGSESKFKPQRESGYYKTIAQARSIFKTPFKGKTDLFVKAYLFDSRKMLNYVYANRGGNGNESSGDGFKFRGGGYIQNTFFDGYKDLQNGTGIRFLDNPDLILVEANSLVAACYFWKKNNLNKYADINDLDGVSDLINIGRKTTAYGDSNGFEHREQIFNALKPYFT